MINNSVNKPQRIVFLDLARGFTGLFIPFIHSLVMFGNNETPEHPFLWPFIFIAEWPGAQLFLLLLGVNCMLKPKVRAIAVLLRCLILFAIGYTLNFFKFFLPVELGIMPEEFVNDISPANYSVILIGDILHLAALSSFIAFLIRHSKQQVAIASLSIVATLIIAQHIPVYGPTVFDQHISKLLFSIPPYTYFPFFPWFTYVLVGIIIGHLFNKIGQSWMWMLIPIGAIMLSFIELIAPETSIASFYQPTPIQVLKHAGFLLIWLATWFLIEPHLHQTRFAQLLTFCSKNLTILYCIQWPLICFLIPLFGYKSMSIASALFAATLCTIATLLLSNHIKLRSNRHGL